MRKWVQIDEDTEHVVLKVPKAITYEEYPRVLYLKKGGDVTVASDAERDAVEARYGKWGVKPGGPFDGKVPELVDA